MPTLTLVLPNTGPVIATLVAVAQAAYAASQDPPPAPILPVLTPGAALVWYLKQHLRDVYRQQMGSAARGVRSTAVTDAEQQALTDFTAVIP